MGIETGIYVRWYYVLRNEELESGGQAQFAGLHRIVRKGNLKEKGDSHVIS